MTFDEWLESYFSGTQIDDVVTGMMRTAFEAGKCEAETIGLRDKFAMAALQGLVANSCTEGSREQLSRWAYEFANIMLKERMK